MPKLQPIKSLLIIAFFAFSSAISYSQYSARVYTFRPTGNFGSVMKSLYSLELGKSDFFSDGNFRTTTAVNFMIFKPRLDTFLTYSTTYDGYEGLRVTPKYQVIGNYITVNGYFGVDWSPVSFGNFYPYIGGDFHIGLYRYKDDSESDMGVLFGLRARVGIEYEYARDLSFFLNANRQGWINLEPRSLPCGWDIGLGAKYSF